MPATEGMLTLSGHTKALSLQMLDSIPTFVGLGLWCEQTPFQSVGTFLIRKSHQKNDVQGTEGVSKQRRLRLVVSHGRL